jgi:hypothetical protein
LKKKFVLRTLPSAFIYIVLFTITTPLVIAGEAENFIDKLKSHYHKTSSITAFSLSYRYFGHSDPYQSWDYKAPSRYIAFKVTDMDLHKKQYAQNVVHHYTGGLLVDEVHFQNDTESLRYEKNGILLGKRIRKQGMNSFERYKNLTLMNVDFFAIRPLFEENNVLKNINIQQNTLSKEITLIHKNSDDKVMEYVFSSSPLRLLSINNKSRRRIYVYSDYKTTSGLTFAHSLIKYYNGDTAPSFITQTDSFTVLDEVEPTKFQLPVGYGPIIPSYNNELVLTEIAPNLYLVANDSADRNTLFKVKGNEIMAFGAPVNSKRSEQSIELILKQFPQKRITSVYVTHPYSDHIAGLTAFTKIGAVIRADAYSIKAIKAYPRFKKDISTFKFETIENNNLIDGVRFYVLENSRAKRQSFAYFEDDGVIYQSDFLDVPFDNTGPKILPNYSKTFIDFVRSKQLKIKRIVGHHHNNNISLDVMNKLYDSTRM